MSRHLFPRTFAALALASLALAAAVPTAAAGVADKKPSGPVTVRLGYFPNVTHASAIVGVEGGLFQKALGKNKLQVSTFNAGPETVQALFSEAIDAAYVGPNPAINAFAKSNGKAVRIISGSASGGAFLVVKPGITKPSDLKGKKVASPQLGGTQDVALRTWLKSKRLETDTTGGGDVSVLPQENAQTLDTFESGAIDGAWVPEPWATRLVKEAGGKVLVDERDLWPGGRYVTTLLVVRTSFLKANPDAVKKLLAGQVAANDFIKKKPEEAQQLVAQGIKKITGKEIKPELVSASFSSIAFTNDPISSSLKKSAKNAEALGLLQPVNLKGIYDLGLLNKVLKARGQREVHAT